MAKRSADEGGQETGAVETGEESTTETTTETAGAKGGSQETGESGESGGSETGSTTTGDKDLIGHRVDRVRRQEAAKRQDLEKENQTLKAGLRTLAGVDSDDPDAALKAAETREANRTLQLKRQAFMTEATRIGLASPDRCFNLVKADDINVDDEGNITGAKEAAEALLEEMPNLKAKTEADKPGVGVPTNPAAREQVSGKGPVPDFNSEEFKSNPELVRKWGNEYAAWLRGQYQG